MKNAEKLIKFAKKTSEFIVHAEKAVIFLDAIRKNIVPKLKGSKGGKKKSVNSAIEIINLCSDYFCAVTPLLDSAVGGIEEMLHKKSADKIKKVAYTISKKMKEVEDLAGHKGRYLESYVLNISGVLQAIFQDLEDNNVKTLDRKVGVKKDVLYNITVEAMNAANGLSAPPSFDDEEVNVALSEMYLQIKDGFKYVSTINELLFRLFKYITALNKEDYESLVKYTDEVNKTDFENKLEFTIPEIKQSQNEDPYLFISLE